MTRVALPAELTSAAADQLEAAAARALQVAGRAARLALADGPPTPEDLTHLRQAWAAQVDQRLLPKLAAAYAAAGLALTDALAVEPPAETGAAVAAAAPEQAAAYLAAASNRLVGAADALWQSVRAALVEGFALGEGVEALAARVAAATALGAARARNVARTEALGASNAGALAEVAGGGWRGTKTWLSAHDDRVRPTHVRADGQTVRLDEHFMVGGWPAQRPHDPNLPAEETVNCRCTLAFELEPGGRLPPALEAAAGGPAGAVQSGPGDGMSGSEATMPWHVADDHPDCPDGYAVVNEATGQVEEGGCHPTAEEAQAHADALYANVPEGAGEGAAAATGRAAAAPGGVRAATLALEDVPTREFPAREFEAGQLTWAELPLPLKWQEREDEGHKGSVIVGRIDRIWREPAADGQPGRLRGDLVFDLDGEHGAEAWRLVSGQFLRGGSLLADDITDADLELIYPADQDADGDGEDGDGGAAVLLFGPAPERVVFHSGRIRSWTLVAEPAFAEATIDLPEASAGQPAGAEALAVELQEETWDGDAAMARCSSSDTPGACFRSICAGRKAGDPALQSSWALPHHSTAGGPPHPAGVRNALGRLPQTQGLTNAAAARRHLEDHLASINASAAPGPDRSVEEILLAAAHTVVIPDVPPAWWFAEPTEEPEIGAVTLTDEGRVFGRLAPLGVAHTGKLRAGQVVYAPQGCDYSRFMNKPALVELQDGSIGRIAAGNVTMGCGHAPALRGPGVAADHYDNSCSVVARVRVGENQGGTWVAGALLADVTPAQVARMLACQLSGDWEDDETRPGRRKLVAALLVPVPGFPVAQPASVRLERGALVASAVPVRLLARRAAADELAAARARRQLADRIAASIGRGPQARRAELAARVHPAAAASRARHPSGRGGRR